MWEIFFVLRQTIFQSQPNDFSISGERFSVLRQTIFKSQPDEKAFPKSLNLERSLPLLCVLPIKKGAPSHEDTPSHLT